MKDMINKSFNEDCLIGMKKIPNKSIDMILCDLPYGTTKNIWDKPLDLPLLWKEYERIIKDNPANSKLYCINKLADKSILKDSAIVDKKDDCGLFKEIR